MSFFGKLKTYFKPVAEKESSDKPEVISGKLNGRKQNGNKQSSTDSFQLIVNQILSNNLLENNQFSWQGSDKFQELIQIQEEKPMEQVENLYVKGFIHVGEFTLGRELTVPEWRQIIECQSIDLQPKKNIYFSILKGIDFTVRKDVWELLANTPKMKTYTTVSYNKLKQPEGIPQKDLTIIDKDVPRSESITKFLPELRNILIAYVNFSKTQYTQGMNFIAGSLLSLLAFENDKGLEEFEIIQDEFEERVFWIFIGIMKWKNWERIFQKDLSGLTCMLQKLSQLMTQHLPAIYQRIVGTGWDLTIFSQYYITILLYNTPKDFSKIILDLFLLDGEDILHSLIIRMMKSREQTILNIHEDKIVNYLQRNLLKDCFQSLQANQLKAKKLQDFQINFLKSSSI